MVMFPKNIYSFSSFYTQSGCRFGQLPRIDFLDTDLDVVSIVILPIRIENRRAAEKSASSRNDPLQSDSVACRPKNDVLSHARTHARHRYLDSVSERPWCKVDATERLP